MPADPPWLQYGSFGLVAVLVFWTLRWGIPSVLAIHKETIAELVSTFTKESEECRGERLSLAAAMTVEREKDRQSRAQLWQQVKEVITSRGTPVAEEYTPPDGMPAEKKP